MSLSPADLLQPEGPVDEALFPDGDAGERLGSYIAQAESKVAEMGAAVSDPASATKLWALYLSFDGAYTLKLARPANENSGVPVLGGQGYITEQYKGLAAKAEAYRLAFEGLVALPAPAPIPATVVRGAVPLTRRW